ncbi:hypothetical protein ZEAMMB73_Zm00001d003152 [Zea mays]|uniref:Uncharacterized protein n=1 Tax=Zea mays TaxID=4577 RepID=A0A1D6E727_MAIZE|nr:hypothetical protein ZEAMMB73_Zm00001d003152 [Zea mays]
MKHYILKVLSRVRRPNMIELIWNKADAQPDYYTTLRVARC